jgi:hypothetical protein
MGPWVMVGVALSTGGGPSEAQEVRRVREVVRMEVIRMV